MITIQRRFHLLLISLVVLSVGCSNSETQKSNHDTGSCTTISINDQQIELCDSAEFHIAVPQTGRYRVTARWLNPVSGESAWLEDHIDNSDERTYDVTGKMIADNEGWASIDGSPLTKGKHQMRLHAEGNPPDSVWISLIVQDSNTNDTLAQRMDGSQWELVWSDEFDSSGLPNLNKWSYNIGNWGWGNNELQYYTSDTMNAKVAEGVLTITAINSDSGWTSARLTTKGDVAFQYGRFEFRAKVPTGRGAWAAGWLLGDSYTDELSWPYCGEIDVLECVGYEIDDQSGAGKNHGTCHTPAYYFKKGNQISGEIDLEQMHTQFHTYAMEWYPDSIRCFVDDVHYYTYDKTANELEWPFEQPQNIIINLAVGGGWGGLKGLDPAINRHEYILDYVRVFERI